MSRAIPWVSLASAYGLYFGALGISAPYLNVYLKDQGYSLTTIGTLSAVMIAVRIVAQPVWSWLADSTAQPVRLARTAAAVSCVLIAFAGWADGWWMIAGLLLWSMMLAACIPQIESLTLTRLGKNRDRYGRIRLWGSIGFIVSVVVVGGLLDEMSSRAVIPLMALAYGALALVLLSIKDQAEPPSADGADAAVSIVNALRKVWVLLLVCFLMQASHAPFYAFFSIHLQSLGYSGADIGLLWAIGVVCEVGVFFVGAQLLRWIGAPWLLVITFAAAALRWGMLAMTADQPLWVAASQCLHGLTFGACHAASIDLVHRHFTPSSRHRGQAIYASVTYGCGTALGTALSGYSWDTYGPQITLLAACGTATLAFVIGVRWARAQR